MKVTSYINTIKNAEYRNYLNQTFNPEQISIIFDGFRYKNLASLIKLQSNDITFEFYTDYYKIIDENANEIIQINKVPSTLYEFIEDINRYNVLIYWSKNIFTTFEPEIILESCDIRCYYENLLSKINKSHELLR